MWPRLLHEVGRKRFVPWRPCQALPGKLLMLAWDQGFLDDLGMVSVGALDTASGRATPGLLHCRDIPAPSSESCHVLHGVQSSRPPAAPLQGLLRPDAPHTHWAQPGFSPAVASNRTCFQDGLWNLWGRMTPPCPFSLADQEPTTGLRDPPALSEMPTSGVCLGDLPSASRWPRRCLSHASQTKNMLGVTPAHPSGLWGAGKVGATKTKVSTKPESSGGGACHGGGGGLPGPVWSVLVPGVWWSPWVTLLGVTRVSQSTHDPHTRRGELGLNSGCGAFFPTGKCRASPCQRQRETHKCPPWETPRPQAPEWGMCGEL